MAKQTNKKIKKIVLAYSGGLDTSVILPWLKDKYGCKVVAFAADLGQGAGELAGIEKKALASGADKCVVADLRREFAERYCFKMLAAGAVYEHLYLMGTSIARPLIAKAQVACALREGADAVAHGATGKGNDQVRFELSYYALNPDIKVVAPWREWDFVSRSDLIEFAEKHQIPVAKDKPLFTPGPLTTSMSVKQAMLRDLGSRDFEFIAAVFGVAAACQEKGALG